MTTDPPVPFGARLAAAMDDLGPLCAGIDPHPALLAAWGLDDDVAGLERFALTCVEAFAGAVAAVKPQAAFFERHGSAGVAVLERVISETSAASTLCVVDAKRGDVGSTMAAYADAFAGEGSPLAGDAVTATAYLGLGSLDPLLERAAATGRGVFVLALTSNPEGVAVQHALAPDSGRAVARDVAEGVAAINAATLAAAGGDAVIDLEGRRARADGRGGREGAAVGDGAGAGAQARAGGAAPATRSARTPLGSVGLVVGATVGDAPRRLGIDLAAVGGPLLAPGLGAQGAGPADLERVFGDARGAVLPAMSRELLAAGPDVGALREAARRAAQACAAGLGR